MALKYALARFQSGFDRVYKRWSNPSQNKKTHTTGQWHYKLERRCPVVWDFSTAEESRCAGLEDVGSCSEARAQTQAYSSSNVLEDEHSSWFTILFICSFERTSSLFSTVRENGWEQQLWNTSLVGQEQYILNERSAFMMRGYLICPVNQLHL